MQGMENRSRRAPACAPIARPHGPAAVGGLSAEAGAKRRTLHESLNSYSMASRVPYLSSRTGNRRGLWREAGAKKKEGGKREETRGRKGPAWPLCWLPHATAPTKKRRAGSHGAWRLCVMKDAELEKL